MSIEYRDHKLCVNGTLVEDIVASHRTPAYIYDVDEMIGKLRDYQMAFGAKNAIHYAVKTNSNRALLRAFAAEGCGVDVVSGGEFKRALECGFEGSRIIFAGVGKSHSEIEFALKNNVKMFNVESVPELRRICEIARSLKLCAPISLRLNPDVDALTHPYITTAIRENKFGIDLDQLGEVVSFLKSEPLRLDLKGIGFHLGSQLTDLSVWSEAIEKLKPITANLRTQFPTLDTFDIGGGLGISYDNLSVPTIKDLANLALSQLKGVAQFTICEPGRSIVGSSGVLIARTEYVKITTFKSFLILNTGMHHFLRPALYKGFHKIIPVNQDVTARGKTFDVVGPICESSDVLGKDRELPENIREGDLVAIMDAGAYGFVMASHYNLQEPALEICVHKGIVTAQDDSSTD